MELKRTVVRRMPKGNDLQTHVSLVEAGGERFIEIADFIRSRNEYGRGYHVPLDYTSELSEAVLLVPLRAAAGVR